MPKDKLPVTQAVRALRAAGINFTDHPYTYEERGGTSPFGTRKQMPVYMEESILDLARIYINGGRRGYLVGVDPKDAVKILNPTMVKVGIP
jgi:prolyl-tRNA editing enzyme YbaK/EbsC (Cys-tRNA(Pro) deacylase)